MTALTRGRLPRVSIVVPAYNAEPWIESSVRSLLSQTVEDLEVVVVDDGSTDRTADIVHEIIDPRVVLARLPHAGVSTALNAGLDLARGRVIGFQGADDISLPQRLELQLDALGEGVGFTHSDMMLVDATEKPIGYLGMGPISRHHVLPFLLRTGTPFGNGSILARREVFEGTRFDPAFTIGEDTDHVRQFAPHVDNAHVPAPLYLYRQHDGNATKSVSMERLVLHVERLVDSEPLESLVPEAFRAHGRCREGAAVAEAVIGTHLFRRGFTDLGAKWFDRAARGLTDRDAMVVISAMIDLLSGAPDVAAEKAADSRRTAVSRCVQARAVLELGDPEGAARLYRDAMEIDPLSYDAITGYRSAGAAFGATFVDTAFQRAAG